MLMQERQLNKSQLAKLSGISHVAVGNYLDGRVPHPDILSELSRCLGVTVDYLLKGTPGKVGQGHNFVYSTDSLFTQIHKIQSEILHIESQLAVTRESLGKILKRVKYEATHERSAEPEIVEDAKSNSFSVEKILPMAVKKGKDRRAAAEAKANQAHQHSES